VGEIVNIGHAQELNEPVYLVQFDGCVVGCLEIELVPAPPGLLPETDVEALA
jgi:nitrogen fixation protein NifZ